VASKEIIKQYKPFLDPLGLTYTQYIIMLALWEKEDVYIKELGERLYLDSGTLTPVLKKMETQQLVIRARSHKDERNVSIRLTDKGKQLKNQVLEIPQKIFCTTGLSIEQAASLHTQLRTLLSSLPSE
jgi:DNA-binding MarR family transcriptional regulator